MGSTREQERSLRLKQTHDSMRVILEYTLT